MTRIPLEEILRNGGALRNLILADQQWAAWGEQVCDFILSEVSRGRVEDLVHKFGAEFVSYGNTSTGVVLNVKWEKDGGFTCHTGETIDEALSDMWRRIAVVNAAKEADKHGA